MKVASQLGEAPMKLFRTPLDPGTDLKENEEHEYCESEKEYERVLGELTYMTWLRNDICYAVNYLSQFSRKPQVKHMKALLRIVWYLVGTKDYGLLLGNLSPNQLEAYTDASYGTETKRRSRTGALIFYFGSLVGCQSKIQKTVALSTTEAEYYGMTEAAKLVLYGHNLLKSIGEKLETPTIVNADNKAAIDLCHTTKFHDRTKHIDIRYHAIRYYVEEGALKYEYCCTAEMIADVLTKPLNRALFEKFRAMMNIMDVQSLRRSFVK
jgi:hypothetical protein